MGKKVDLNKTPNNELNHRRHHLNNGTNGNNFANATSLHNTNNNNKKDKQENGIIGEETNGNTTTSSANDGNNKFVVRFPKSVVKPALIILIPVLLFMFLFVFVVMLVSNDTGMAGGDVATRGYYVPQCQEVTVIKVDRNDGYKQTGVATYSLEEYVAGVVRAEVGGFNNIEVYKEFAIAARTFFLATENNCTIEGSDRRQAFVETDDPLIIQAAEDTAGQVFLKDGKLAMVQYDAFACTSKDTNYYTISQANQKIPFDWVEGNIPKNSYTQDWFICDGTLRGHHGNGLSQWGSYYLTTEKGYNYEELINFYLGEEGITISSDSFSADIDGVQIANLEIKDTTNATYLNDRLDNYLLTKGLSIENMNNFITENVKENGWGTRSGVVTAAVSLINYLYDNLGMKIPYYWGGQYQYVGVNPNFGGSTNPSAPSPNGNIYTKGGLDCSGFVSWAIRNGGYKLGRNTTYGFDALFSGDSCNIKDANCVGKPGDLINSKSCHVQMIVAVDTDTNSYYIAESSPGVIMRKWGMHQENCNKGETRILHMDNYYNNAVNVDNSY